MNLRVIAEQDLAVTLEGDWGLPVNLVDPDGVRYDDLQGQVLFDITRIDPATGESMAVDTPVVTLRRSSLQRIPVQGERWMVEIPDKPDPDAPKVQYFISPTRALEGGASIGFIRLYLQKAIQYDEL